MTPDVKALLVGSDDYPAWRTAYVRAVMGVGPVPQLPAVLPLWELLDEARETVGTKPLHQPSANPRPTPKSVTLGQLDQAIPEAEHELTTWVLLCMEERAAEGITDVPPEDTDEAKCVWLASRIEWVEAQPWADEFSAKIRGLHGRLRSACIITKPSPWPCLTEGCLGRMQLVHDALECDNGHRHAGLSRWRFHPSMPASVVAARLNVKPSTIRQWRARKLIQTDESKGPEPHVWPWDVVRRRYPDLVDALEAAK